jgi:hypothetical protein
MKSPAELKTRFLELLPTAVPAEPAPAAKDKGSDHSAHSDHQDDMGGRGIDRLLPMLQNDPLYLCDDGAGYIYRRGRLFLLDSKNQDMVQDLRLDGLELTGKAPSKETVATVIDLLSARARREGIPLELFNRCGEKDGLFYFDMGDGQAVEISPGSWRLAKAPVMFRQWRHQKGQVSPKAGGDPWQFLQFCNMPEELHLLFVVTLATCFIPKIAHPVISVSSSQGSGKSTFNELWKYVIDPSSVMLSNMPRKPEDFDLLLVRHYALVLDNVSSLSNDVCDRICSWVTGGVIEKRTLHTDLDMTILKGNTVIMLNSVVGSLHSRPDLTERTIVFELRRIADENRLAIKDVLQRFNALLPEILGGLFDLLAKAMTIFPTLDLPRLPRMADFAKWGYAIAEAMGGRGDEFLRDYAGNATVQTGALFETDTFFSAVVQAMDDPGIGELSGSFHDVRLLLAEVAAPGGAANGYKELDKDPSFPKSPRAIRGKLDRIRIPLEDMGINYMVDGQRTSRGKAFVKFFKKGPVVLPGDEVPF